MHNNSQLFTKFLFSKDSYFARKRTMPQQKNSLIHLPLLSFRHQNGNTPKLFEKRVLYLFLADCTHYLVFIILQDKILHKLWNVFSQFRVSSF